MATQKEKSEPLRITAPLNYDVKVWMLLVDFFLIFWCWVVSPHLRTWFIQFVWYRNSVCSSTGENLKATATGKREKEKKKPHKSVRAVEVGTLQDLAEILIRGQRRGGRGGRGGGGSVLFRLKTGFRSCSVHQVYFLHRCSGKNVSPLKSLKNSAFFFFFLRTFCLWSKMLLQCYKTFTMFKCRS